METINSTIRKILSQSSKTLAIPESQVSFIIALASAYSFGRTSASKYARKFSIPIVTAILIARAYQLRDAIDSSSNMPETVLSSFKQFIRVSLPNATSLANLLSVLLDDAVGLIVFIKIVEGLQGLSFSSFADLKAKILAELYEYVKILPQVQKVLNAEKVKLEADFERDLKVKSRGIGGPNFTHMSALPSNGLPHEEIINLMSSVTETENVVWQSGRISGAVYHGVQSHQDLLNKAFGFYSISNPLHPDVWPSAMKFESEIIAMTASLVKGNVDTVCGCTTSGGTESIILAIKAHRDFYMAKYRITSPEMVACITAHAAVDKACDLMGIKLIKVPMDSVTCKMNLSAARSAIGPNTIMIYSSAPNYPQGAIDPIRDLGALAVEFGIGLHVDCCLGGFFLPFAKKLGCHVPDFDFSVPGVSSMSLDTHKYGYALKGASVVLYRERELRQAQYFCYADWTGGLYTTPTIAGSRSGGLIAQCWASLVAMGEQGYLKHTKDILEAKGKIVDGVKNIPGLALLGGAEAMIVCFVGVDGINVYSVADRMSKKGWSLNSHQHPPSVHVCCTVRHVGREDELLNDLRDSVKEVRDSPDAKGGTAAIYGMTSSLPSGPVNELLKIYNDVVLKL